MERRFALLALCIGAIIIVSWSGCRQNSAGNAQLPWPPDTIKAELVRGTTYRVTVGHGREATMMKLLCIWPPETTMQDGTTQLRKLSSAPISPWPPETTKTSSSPCAPMLFLIWPPETTYAAR